MPKFEQTGAPGTQVEHFEGDPAQGNRLTMLNKQLSIYSSIIQSHGRASDGGKFYKEYARTINIAVANGVAYSLWQFKQNDLGQQNEIMRVCQDGIIALTERSLHVVGVAVEQGRLSVRASTSEGQVSTITIANLSEFWKGTSEKEISQQLQSTQETLAWMDSVEYAMGGLIVDSTPEACKRAGIDSDGYYFMGIIDYSGVPHAVFKSVGNIRTMTDRNAKYGLNGTVHLALDFLKAKRDVFKGRGQAHAEIDKAIAALEQRA